MKTRQEFANYNVTFLCKLTSKIASLFLLLLLVSCASSTQITGSWKSPEASSKTFDNIIVAALTDNILARQKVEKDMQEQLMQRGIKATRSIDAFPPSRESNNGPDVNRMLDQMRGAEHDAILTVALVDEKTQSRYVPGNVGYRPATRYAWYGNFRGYYTYWYPILYEPGYYTEDKVYYLETNLYDVTSDALLWSAQSRSYSPGSLRKAAEKLAEITINKLAQDNLIKGASQQP